MVEWWNGGMAEWQNGGMAEWRNGGMAEWRNGQTAKRPNGQMAKWPNGQMAKWPNGRMAEWLTKYLLYLLYLRHMLRTMTATPTPLNHLDILTAPTITILVCQELKELVEYLGHSLAENDVMAH
jgi:hypothetical protein